MANVSMDTAETAIEACIKLIGAENIKSSAGDVLELILEASGARACRIVLIDHEEKGLSPSATG